MRERASGGRRQQFLLRSLGLLLVAALGLAAATPAWSQEREGTAGLVSSIEVQGTVTVDPDLVRRGFGLAVGSRYSADAVRRGIRRLYDLGFFSDIAVDGDPSPDGVRLTLIVVENPRVSAVEFSGNDKLSEKDIQEHTGSLVGRMADDRLLARVNRRVADLYREKGYTRARVGPRYLPGASDSRRILLVEIEEGSKVRVETIRFVGLQRIDPGKLRGSMKQGTTGFLKGGVYKPDLLVEDKARIEAELARNGFRDGEVLDTDVLPGSRDDRVVMEVQVREGPRYYVGSVAWEGNEAIPAPALYAMTRLEAGSVFNQTRVEETIERAYDLYLNRGYIYLNIQPDYSSADSTVNVTFLVREGEPSRVHDIIITGNTRTKEHVIRRQLALRPGDLFRRNLLIRSQRELQQLGYFSDLRVDSRQVPGTTDIDLILDVEERQVGTASAGFGFSSAVGLTGFMELGHTNLFGNGQSLNLRMERGRSRNNAELSFTEPWFRGSPTTVGVDLFSTNRIFRGPDLDLEVRRTGGAVRVGRPLPIPYTRIFASYRLESQTVVDETNTDNADTLITGRIIQTGFRLDQETSLTSGISLSVVRNSTDHPLYPTVGSNTRLRAEVSGGPLGGDQVFQKYELDISQYLKTLSLAKWTPVLMLRSRMGAVTESFRDDPLLPESYEFVKDSEIPPGAVEETVTIDGRELRIPVPRHLRRYPPDSNELFRLGGTSFNPLRGYDDFEIVPRGNVLNRYLVTSTTDTLGVTTYNVTDSPVYYPGGKYLFAFTTEWQFPIADPLHGLLFFDVGGTWNRLSDLRFNSMHRSLGIGFRMEVPLLGLIGFDYGYGFDRLNRSNGRYDERGWEPHIQFGRIF